jgi:tetratricopeptide (TPR) repeat protein
MVAPMNRLFLLFLLVAAAATAQTPSLLEQGRTAEAAENYQHAIDLYRQAQAGDPTDPAPAKALAQLFTAKGLHDLALPSWQEALQRAPGDAESWQSLAQTWSYLDKNTESVKTLQKAVDRFPADPDATQALAWMLFKTEDYSRGIALVESFIAIHGADRGLEMTLGTLYSSLYAYDLSRVHYLKSLDLTRGTDSLSKNFRSIAWYNLSLLEKAFHQFELADQGILNSIKEEDRPAGSLARGELFQGRRDFDAARKLYERAALADDTPLARFDLARLFQEFGRLDEAEAQLEQVEHHTDDTWIYNYGVTKDKISRDIHELRADLHRARFHALDFTPRTNPWEWAVWALTKVQQSLLWWYHDQTWKGLLVKLADSSRAMSNSPDAWVSLFQAERDRPDLALKYLRLARNHELPKNPRALGSYLTEEGLLTRDPATLTRALARLEGPWENDDRERVLAALAAVRQAQGAGREFRSLLTDLYALNPGGLPCRGWGLPVRMALFGDEVALPRWKAAWADYIGQTGWNAGGRDQPGVTWSLDLRVEAEAATWTLRDADGTTARSGLVRVVGGNFAAAASTVFQQIHSPR